MPNNNPDISPLPPDALALLEDPRLEGQVENPAHASLTTIVLQPAVKPSGESRYLALHTSSESDPNFAARWINRDECKGPLRPGTGFAKFPALARVEVARKAPKRLFHLAEFQRTKYYVASPDMVQLLAAEAPGSFEAHPVEWVFNDGQALDGYALLDFVTLHRTGCARNPSHRSTSSRTSTSRRRPRSARATSTRMPRANRRPRSSSSG